MTGRFPRRVARSDYPYVGMLDIVRDELANIAKETKFRTLQEEKKKKSLYVTLFGVHKIKLISSGSRVNDPINVYEI